MWVNLLRGTNLDRKIKKSVVGVSTVLVGVQAVCADGVGEG